MDVHKNDAKSDLNQSNNCFIQPHNVRFEPKFLESVTVLSLILRRIDINLDEVDNAERFRKHRDK